MSITVTWGQIAMLIGGFVAIQGAFAYHMDKRFDHIDKRFEDFKACFDAGFSAHDDNSSPSISTSRTCSVTWT